MADEGHDAPRLIRQAVDWHKEWGYPSRIIVGSVREVINIQDAALAGAHVITVPPQFMDKMLTTTTAGPRGATIQPAYPEGPGEGSGTGRPPAREVGSMKE